MPVDAPTLSAETLAMVCVAVQEADFDLSEEVAALRQGCLEVGAVVSFVGTVRQWVPAAHGPAALELTHYPGMTERVLTNAAQAALSQFGVQGVRIIHRVGVLALGEQIVLVAVAAMHRQAAFACCEYLMDWLKTQAPFWKKEHQGGVGRWVEARAQDDAALARWQGANPRGETS